jgi:hypothetical protein
LETLILSHELPMWQPVSGDGVLYLQSLEPLS